MTDSTQTTGPEVKATLGGDGTAVVTIDGVAQTLTANDDAGAMRQAMSVVADKAREIGEPITVQTSDPAHGDAALTVSPDGNVSTGTETVAVPETVTSRRELRTARDFASTKKAAPTGPAEEGFRGFVNRATFGGMKLAPGAHETTRRDWNAAIQRGLLDLPRGSIRGPNSGRKYPRLGQQREQRHPGRSSYPGEPRPHRDRPTRQHRIVRHTRQRTAPGQLRSPAG
jgi:hypothetical protein